jgi:general secretion pathway protein H
MGERARGFTLIEVLVVVMIIVVIVGLVGVRLARGPDDIVREESEHLALVLSAAREEAILQGRVFAFGAGRESYRFMRLEKDGRLKLTGEDELLRPKRLPHGIAIELLKIEGVGEETLDGLVFLPSGELPAFRIVLAGGGIRWSVVGEPDGTIRARAGS